jgi:hypothetical protein
LQVDGGLSTGCLGDCCSCLVGERCAHDSCSAGGKSGAQRPRGGRNWRGILLDAASANTLQPSLGEGGTFGIDVGVANGDTAFDGNRDGRVAINELVAGVNNALAGCRP